MKESTFGKTLAYFKYVFIGFVVFDILVSSFGHSDYRIISKPLIVSSLLIYFALAGKHLEKPTYRLFILALLCSLLGDVFLLFESQGNIFFTLGLASFLIAHIIYSLVFIKKWNKKTSSKFKWIALLLFLYGGLLFYLLKDYLEELKLPVILYILGILAMVLTAYRRRTNVPQSSFDLVFIGALFFVLSDSVLAINRFMTAIPLSHVIIMGTYALAQYLITVGVLKQKSFEI